MKNISYHKEKAEREIVELRDEVDFLKKELNQKKHHINTILEKTVNDLDEANILLKKYKKAIISRNSRISEQEMTIRSLSNDISSIHQAHERFINAISTATGLNAKELKLEELSEMLIVKLKEAEEYKDQNSIISVLKNQQKNDRRSLMLNASLISELKDKAEKLQIQLDFLQETTASIREKDLEEENEHLSATVRQLNDEIRSLRKLISRQK